MDFGCMRFGWACRRGTIGGEERTDPQITA